MSNVNPTTSIVITAMGMITPVGLGAYQSCASIRADIARLEEFDDFYIEDNWGERIPVQGGRIKGVTDGYHGLGRWVRLSCEAIQDLMSNAGLNSKDLAQFGLFIGLPPLDRPGVDDRIATMLGARISQWHRIEGWDHRTRCYNEGHAAVVKAISDGMEALHRGEIMGAIIGGVDSLVERETLAYFAEKSRLKNELETDGFHPGESAAFFLLETEKSAIQRGADILSRIYPPFTANEPITIWMREPSTSTALADCVANVLNELEDQGKQVGLVICDLNGEPYRSKEYANVVSRTMGSITAQWQLWHPSDVIGDTGAASAGINICVGARALHRGYALTKDILICCSSDSGLRGAICLEHYTKES